MKVCHLIPYIGIAQGGPVMSLATLAPVLQKAHCQITVGSIEKPNDGKTITLNDIELIKCERSFGGIYRWSPSLAEKLFPRDFDLVHSHGLWTYTSFLAGHLASKKHIPHILAPCGMLNPKALKRSNWKKLICRGMFQEHVLKNTACLHAKSEAEYNDFRRFGLKNPVAVIPNPIEMPSIHEPLKTEIFRQRHGISGEKKTILYLGRLHPVKGLERLSQAWGTLNQFHDTWQLVIAGPSENSYLTVLKDRVRSLRCAKNVTFTGELSSSEKWIAYNAADLFVMPSDFENFGSAIAEAMMGGLPVITTNGTPWKVLATEGAGWWISPSIQDLVHTLREGMMISDSERRIMGERGKILSKRFRPERVVEDMISVYQWLTNNCPRPQCVQIT